MTKNLPRISVITPSFNQTQFIEKTIRSVLSQNYPHLEYIVMDGGSTDGTIDILKKYKGKIKWYSQKDKGQSEAINKGIKMATGEIIAYLNSDDYLEEKALWRVGEYFLNNKHAFWATGKCRIVDENGTEVRRLITVYKNILLKYSRSYNLLFLINFICQPATFLRKEVFEELGLFDEKLHFTMDYDYWLRVWKKYDLSYIDEYLASFRVHQRSKSVTSPDRQFLNEYKVVKRYANSQILLFIKKIHTKSAVFIYKHFLN